MRVIAKKKDGAKREAIVGSEGEDKVKKDVRLWKRH